MLTGENNDTYNPNAKKLFDDVFFKLGHPGYGYHLPSRWELTGVFSYSGNTQYDSPTNTSNVNEAIEFGGIKKTFANDYFSSGNGVCYALRFKQGTGNPIDDSSLSDFPLATDNNMVCAYRYTRVGSFANHDFTSLLKVDCVYLGSAFTGNISTINNDSWWDSHTSEAVVRIFRLPVISPSQRSFRVVCSKPEANMVGIGRARSFPASSAMLGTCLSTRTLRSRTTETLNTTGFPFVCSPINK